MRTRPVIEFARDRGPHAGPDQVRYEPDTLLPSQLQPRRATSPEEALLLAVAESALDDLIRFDPRITPSAERDKHRARRQVLYSRAWSWFADADYPVAFTLRDVCEYLGLDLDAVRGSVLRAFPAPQPDEDTGHCPDTEVLDG